MNKKYEELIKRLDNTWNVISMTDKEAISYYELITNLDKEQYKDMSIFDIKDYLLEYATKSLIEQELINYEEAGKLIDYIERKWKNENNCL